MLRFFRQIRQRFLADNKFRKYLLYAVGEILLVVIGILIALQINTWNEDRLNHLKEKEYLTSILIQIDNHIEELSKHRKYSKSRLHSIDYLISAVDTPKEELSRDSMLFHLNLMQWVGNIDLDKSMFEDLINTGNLALIRNKDIRIAIQNYFYRIEKAISSTKTNNDFYIHNAISFYMKHLSMGHIIRTPSKVDSEGAISSRRKLFELWDYGYESAEMKEFENNLYFRRTDLDLEIARNLELMDMGIELRGKISEYLKL